MVKGGNRSVFNLPGNIAMEKIYRRKYLSSQHLAAYHQFLYLTRTLAYRAKLRIAVMFFYREIFRVSITTKDLYSIIGNFYGYFARIIFCHRCLFGNIPAANL